MSQSYKSFGQHGEELVANWLIKNGFKIKEKNYRKKFGEIDLIAIKKDIVAFIEVKSRNNRYFNLSEIINNTKQKKIIRTAKEYICRNHLIDKICRFDVAFVEKVNQDLKIEYIENAFIENNEF